MDLIPRHPADDDPNPLNRLSLDRLRRRTSMKWRTYPDDVLPLWVAEMDVPLAEPVVRAVTDAMALGDTGYPAGTAYAEALAGFARERWGWDGLAVERTAIVPDVSTPYLSVSGAESGLSLMSVSKGWNLAGLKAALAIAGPGAAEDLARLPEEVGHGLSHIGVIAHTAALREGGDWLDALLGGLHDNRALLTALLARDLPGVRYRPGPATFLAWLDCRALGLGDDPAAVFLDRGRVALNSGLPFGTGGAGHVRLNLATSPELLAEAVRRRAAALT
ncbi:aminotransferase class I/II-fold pyridoxal phosphate-dependent enzyme [Streptomyces sp. NBRC 110028]|uniref:aminotransferase class I/II-fold pyridoxal phosphate-dependent enzyme n=1 Tax=Streptomyces sp. NBRC 110028 TaxID=1621260 RepID=UPI0006E27670|nr:aminotransferase class I/II-fold pyridoxal phosphate-dependent enzyme [Streptomyces sp. NBRC 110028]